MGFSANVKKELNLKTAKTSFTQKVKTELVQQDNTTKMLQAQKVSALKEKNAIKPTITPQYSLQKQQDLMDFMEKPLIKPLVAKPKANVPYVNTFKEVPKNIKSGNILGGLSNSLKGVGQMALEGLSAPQKLVLNASKGIIDTHKGKKASFNPNITTDSYLKDTGNAQGDKFYNSKVGQFAKGVFNLGSDPFTVVGGGIADDVLRATTKGAKGLENLGNIGKKASEKMADNPIIRSLNDKLTTVSKGTNANLAAREALTAANKIDSANKPLNDLPTIKLQSDVITPDDKFMTDRLKNATDSELTPYELKYKQTVLNRGSASETVAPAITKEVPTVASIKPKLTITTNAQGKRVISSGLKSKAATINIDNPTKVNLQSFNEAEKATGELKTSQFRENTIERATEINDTAREMFPENEFRYEVEKVADWQNQAVSNINKNKKSVEFEIRNASDSLTKVQQHEAAILYKEFEQEAMGTGDWTKALSFMKTVTRGNTEAGRNLKAIDSAWEKKTAAGAVMDAVKAVDGVEEGLKKTNPAKLKKINEETDGIVKGLEGLTDVQKEARLKQIFKPSVLKPQRSLREKVLELIDLGAYDKESIRDLIKLKEGLPILEVDDIKKITEYMNKAKTFAEGSYDQRDMYGRVGLLIANKVPASLTTKIVHAPRMAMLGAMKTFFTKNFGGNVGNDVYEEFIRSVPSSIIDMVVSKIAKTDRTILFPSVKTIGTKLKGYGTGFAEQTKDIIRGTNTAPNMVAGEIPQGRIYKTKILNGIDQFIRAGLQYGDRPTFQSVFDETIRQQKKILKTDTITDSMKTFAHEVASDRVFQNKSETAKGLGGLRTGINQMGKGLLGIGGKEGGVGNAISPFINTAANIAEKVVDNTPIAATKIYGLIRDFKVATGVEKTIAQRKLVDTLGRMITGTATVGLGIEGVKKGILTGRANKDADMANFDKETGKQPYSIKIGDKYTPYTSLPPLSTALAIGSDIGANMKEGSSKLTSVLDGAKTGTNTFMQQSFLKGFSDLFGYGDFANGASRVATSYPSQWIPQTLNAAAKFGDKFDRQTYDPNSLKYTANSMQTRIPGKRQELPIKQNIFGEDTKNFNGHTGAQRFLDAFIYPVSSSKYDPTSVQKEIARLYDKGGTKIQVPTVVDKSILATKDHPKIELTAAEYNQYQKRTGQLTMNGSLTVLPSISGFNNVINSDRYRNAIATKDETVDIVKANMLAKEIGKAKAQAKKEILKARGYDK